MALDVNRMLMQLSPVQPVDFGSGQKSYAREQLELARQQFEETKKQHLQQMEWQKTEEAGRNARARMEAERQAAEAEALRQAKLLEQQQAAMQKFGELAGSGKVQQAEALAPYLDQLGYDVNTLGNVGGLPVFQMQNRAQEAQKADQEWQHSPRPIDQYDGGEGATQSLARMGAEGLGYPTNERGTLDEPVRQPAAGPLGAEETQSFDPGEGSLDDATSDALTPGDEDLATAAKYGGDGVADVSVGRGLMPASLSKGDAYAQALAATQSAKETGKPARGPDEEDFQGAVPRNVIDLPAMNAETNARLSPMLKSMTGSLPEELRPSAEAAAKGAAGLGLEAPDVLAEYGKAMTPAIDIYKNDQNITAQKEKNNQLTPVQAEQLKEMGVKRGNLSFKNGKVAEAVDVINAADTVEGLMKEGGKRNHEKAVNYLMKMTGNKGAQTEADALRVIGRGKLDSIEQLEDWLHERAVGGFSEPEIASINEFVDMQRKSSTERVYGWLASNDQQMRNPKTHERTRAGYEEFRNGGSIPPKLLDDYEARAKKAEAEGRGSSAESAPAGEAGAELQRQAEAAGLNGQVLGKLMGGESGGDPNAANENRTDGAPKSSAKGVFQLLDQTAKDIGYKDAADYAAQPLAKQIEGGLQLFKNKGITDKSPPEDYALVLAAPSFVGKWKSRDDVVYKKDSDEWKANAPWRPTGGGDITVGSIADYYMGKGGKTAAPAKGEATGLPEPKNPAEKRIADLLKKRGG